jgi:hypothetical protein
MKEHNESFRDHIWTLPYHATNPTLPSLRFYSFLTEYSATGSYLFLPTPRPRASLASTLPGPQFGHDQRNFHDSLERLSSARQHRCAKPLPFPFSSNSIKGQPRCLLPRTPASHHHRSRVLQYGLPPKACIRFKSAFIGRAFTLINSNWDGSTQCNC